MSGQSKTHDVESQSSTVPTGGRTEHVDNKFDRKYLDDLVHAANPELLIRDNEGNTVVNLATLQRLMLFQLQVDILEQIEPIINRRYVGKNPLKDEGLRKNLSDYTQAVQNWELMVDHQRKAAGSTTGDPFHISAKWLLTKKTIDSKGLHPGTAAYARGSLDKMIGTFDQRTRINKRRSLKALAVRFTMSMLGGVLLIGPMILMVYLQDLKTAIATTSVSVTIFATIMSCFTDATPEVMVGAVAAYAAVLVVFVGTNLDGAKK